MATLRPVKRAKLTNTHVRLNKEEAAKAVKKAALTDPEINLSSLIRALLRKYISSGGKI
jgi:hypothetical protein